MTDAQKRIADARETAQELRRSIAAGVRHEAADAIVTLAEDLAAALKRAEEAEAGYRDQNAQAEAWKRTANELYRGSMTEAETDAGLKLMRAHMRQRDEMRVDRDAARTDCQAMAQERDGLRETLAKVKAKVSEGLDALQLAQATIKRFGQMQTDLAAATAERDAQAGSSRTPTIAPRSF